VSAAAPVRTRVPFLGLHYFDEEHQDLFFGREEQLRDLLAKLAESRFVTVIGSSGTGKSSLVHAGLVPALRQGFITAAGSDWQIIKLKPGGSPVRNLAAAFARPGIEVTLRRGPLGLIEAARQCRFGNKKNLLVFVDQFEELFRYQRDAPDRKAAAEEAAGFVNLLLEAAAGAQVSIYVLLTMRSEYLGACAQFRDLPERINTGLYLIPRMRRDQLEEAITGPAAVAGACFTPPLVQQLLNDAGEDPDQLSVVQHALLRTWLNWANDPAHPKDIEFRHYNATGGVRNGLNQHATEIYDHLDPDQQRVTRFIFRCLTERDPTNNDIRRPTRLDLIARIAGVSEGAVAEVAGKFRQPDVSFLSPAATEAETSPQSLPSDTRLDITHESLIHRWYRLGAMPDHTDWVQEEANLRDQYRDLVKRARRDHDSSNVLSGTDLQAALEWRDQRLPAEWGLRQDPAPDAYGLVQEYVSRSEKTKKRQALRRRLYVALVAATVIAFLAVVAYYRYRIGEQRFLMVSQRAQTEYEKQLQIVRDQQKELEVAKQRERADSEASLRQEATDEAGRAEHFKTIATARQLAAQSEGLRNRDAQFEASALLAVESLQRYPLPEGIRSLRWPLSVVRRPIWTVKPPENVSDADKEAHITGFYDNPILDFSPDGQYLAEINSDGTLHLFTSAIGKELPLPAIEGGFTSHAWSGNQLLVGLTTGQRGENTTVFSLTPGSQNPQRLLDVPCDQDCVASLADDGHTVVVQKKDEVQFLPLDGGPATPMPGGGKLVELWTRLSLRDMSKGKPNPGSEKKDESEQEDSGPHALEAFDSSGVSLGSVEVAADALMDVAGQKNVLAVNNSNQVVKVYLFGRAIHLAREVFLQFKPAALALSADGDLLAVGDNEGGVRVYDWRSLTRLAAYSQSGPIEALGFGPNATLASLDEAGELRVVPLSDGNSSRAPSGAQREASKPPDTLLPSPPFSGRVVGAFFDPDARYVVVRGLRGGDNLVDTATNKTVLFGDARSLLILSPDGHFAAYGSPKAGLAVANLDTHDSVSLPCPNCTGDGPLLSLALGPGGRYLAVKANTSSPLQIADVNSRSWIKLPRDLVTASSPVFSPDGRWLFLRISTPTRATTPNLHVLLIDCAQWKVVSSWAVKSRPSVVPLFSPSGRFLLLRGAVMPQRPGNEEAASLLLDLRSAAPLEMPLRFDASLSAAAFTADSRYLATVGDKQVRIFELPSAALRGHFFTETNVTRMAFSPSGALLAVSALSAAPHIFQVSTGQEISNIGKDENEGIFAYHFTADERSLEFVSESNMSGDVGGLPQELFLRRQFLYPADLIREACSRVSRNLTGDEWRSYLKDYSCHATCPNLPNLCSNTRAAH
jgi:WD40 repeat protein